MQSLNKITNKKHRLILGLMSGTSCDGLDIALLKISSSGIATRFEFIKGQTYPYSKTQKHSLLEILQAKKTNASQLSQLNFYLANIWADMIKDFLKENNLVNTDIDLIGSHGQTIWHEPQKSVFIDRDTSSTLQLGDPSVLAQLSGIAVVGDFRVADVALGGQGAPLIPYFDWLYFSQFKKNILSLNIGGISNFTFVPASGDIHKVVAFDCGPGNMLIDLATQKFYDLPFDENGLLAAEGNLDSELFNVIKEKDSFTNAPPPKSTGRELYGRKFLDKILDGIQNHRTQKNNILHTLTEYTAYSIYENYYQFITPHNNAQLLLVGGGGAKNSFLMERLAHHFDPVPVELVQNYGLDENFKEAIGFAILANETIHGIASNVPTATGASRPAILGKICIAG